MRPPILKADLEATIEIRIASMSRAFGQGLDILLNSLSTYWGYQKYLLLTQLPSSVAIHLQFILYTTTSWCSILVKYTHKITIINWSCTTHRWLLTTWLNPTSIGTSTKFRIIIIQAINDIPKLCTRSRPILKREHEGPSDDKKRGMRARLTTLHNGILLELSMMATLWRPNRDFCLEFSARLRTS